MRSFVPVLFTTALLGIVQAGFGAPNNPNEAQYMFGTIKTIPTNTVGSLDLTDPSDLQFQYGDLTYRLPYRQIKSFHFADARTQPRTIAHVPVPRLPFHARAQMLDVSFFDKNSSVGTVTFQLSGKNLKSAEWILTERMRVNKQVAQDAGRSKLPESWWGDKYWKTLRNRPGWPDAVEPAGTK